MTSAEADVTSVPSVLFDVAEVITFVTVMNTCVCMLIQLDEEIKQTEYHIMALYVDNEVIRLVVVYYARNHLL